MAAWNDLGRIAARAARSSPAELWFSARAWVLAPAVEVALRALGLRLTLRMIGAVRRPGFVPRDGGAAIGLTDGARCVDRAYAVHAVRGRCLPRSSLQHLIHRLDGTPSRLVIGVREGASTIAGVDAHAWVAPAEGPIELEGFAPLMILDERGVRPAEP